jgi:two-component system, NtrC family, sensor kinase
MAASGQEAHQEIELLAEVASLLSSAIGSESVLTQVVELLRRSLPVQSCSLWVRNRAGDAFRPVAPDRADAEEIVSEVDVWLQAGVDDATVRLPLSTEGKPLGLFEARFRPGTGARSRRVLKVVADTLALWLASTELSEDLAVEVAYRTREIDAHRRFTARIIDSLPVGLYVVDREYRIQAWNRKRETGTQGIDRDEVLGRQVFEVLTRQPKDLLKREFDNVFKTGQMEQMDVESAASGETRYFRISKIPMRLHDREVTHVITIGEDATEWKTIQQQISQTEKLAAVGQLAAGIMHELNNPLATIGACVEALTVRMPDLQPAEQRTLDEYLRIIDSELERCKAIVDGLLDFSNPKARKKQPESVNQIVEDALFLIKHHDHFRGITLIRELTDDLPAIYGNAKQLIQVFLAIMLNAIDSMEGQGTLTVTTARNYERDDEVLVAFSDTGFGIAREDLTKIFEPFYTTKLPGRGTGLGLSICYAMVQEHRGRVIVDSQMGRGSTFKVYLPTSDSSAALRDRPRQ